MSEGTSNQPRFCTNCGSEVRSEVRFCVSCGHKLGAEEYSADTRTKSFDSDSVVNNTASTSDTTSIVWTAAKMLVVFSLFFILFNYSMGLGLIVLMVAILILIIRRLNDRQTPFEQRVFEKVRQTHEEVGTNYHRWSENQAAERERNELLRKAEGERNQRRIQFNRYRRFFERGYSGSSTALSWWQAYEDESDQEQPSVPDLLRLARERAEKGLDRMREMETSFSSFLQREEFEQADLFLNDVRTGQENFETEDSIFPPLVAVHNKVKQLEDWSSYIRELETFAKELEDLLDSPLVRTAPANRVRFPNPGSGNQTDPGRSDNWEHVESNKPYQGGLTDEERRAESNGQVFKWVAIPAGILLVVFLALSQGYGEQPVPSDGEINWDIVYEPTQEQFDYCLDTTNYEASENPTCEEILINASSGYYYEDPETGDPYIP